MTVAQILKHATFGYPVYGLPDASSSMADMSSLTFGDKCAVGDIFQLAQNASDGAIVLAVVRMDRIMTITQSFDEFYDRRVEIMAKAKHLGYDTLCLRHVSFAGTFRFLTRGCLCTGCTMTLFISLYFTHCVPIYVCRYRRRSRSAN
jgi:hypothetical protein